VVEDDPTLLSMLAFALRASGHTPLLKSDAVTTLEELPDEAPDVILCDVHLPGMNGAEITQLLRSAPLLADTPVILISDDDEPFEHTADTLVTKPFGPMEVVELVEELASRNQ